MFVELSVVLKGSGSWLVAGEPILLGSASGRRLCLLPAQGSRDGWSFALSLCRKPARYFWFTSDFFSAEPKMSLFVSWITFSESQVCIDLKRKHLLKSSIGYSHLQCYVQHCAMSCTFIFSP